MAVSNRVDPNRVSDKIYWWRWPLSNPGPCVEPFRI